MLALSIKRVTKYYGKLCAVKNLNLEIKDGEIFGLLGPNGAGKTTTIKMCVGLLKPTEGNIKIFGRKICDARNIFGYIPDFPFFYEKLTGREFLNFVASLYKIEKKEREYRIEELSSIFRISDRLDDFIDSYSRGMRQKISIISALLNNPKILFVDEPFTGLDPYSMKKFKEMLHIIVQDGGAVFLSTHILDIAEKLCTKIGILHSGELVAIGTIEELKQKNDEEIESLEDIFLIFTEKSHGGVNFDF